MSVSKTYSKTCSAVGGFSYAGNFKLYIKLTDKDGSSSTNKSTVDYNVYCQADGSGSINAKHKLFFKINEKEIIDETKTITASSPDAKFTIAKGSIEVTHKDDGSKSIDFEASVTASSYGVKASTSGSFALEKIPRYFSKKPEAHKTGKTETTYTIEWTTSETCSKVIFYMSSTKKAEWTGSAKSGTLTVTGLTAGTSYPDTYIIATRKDSKLTTKSTPTNRETEKYPYIESISTSELTIGNSQTISIYNPLSRSVAIKMYKTNTNGTELYSGSTTGTRITFTPNANTLYSSITSAQSAACVYAATYGITTTKSGTYKIKGTEKPTIKDFSISSTEYQSLTGDPKRIILGYSNVTATPSSAATPNNYADSIKEYKTVIGNASAKSPSASAMTIPNATSNRVVMSVTDSRGLSSSKTVDGIAVNYSKILISSLSAKRNNNINPQSTLNFTISFWNKSFGVVQNSIKEIYYEYKKTSEPSESSWKKGTTKINVTLGNKITGSLEIAGDLDAKGQGETGFDINNSYNIRLFVRDELSNHTLSTILTTGLPAIAICGNKVAIGAKYDETLGGTLQIYGKAIYGTEGLYSPHSAGVYFDQYGNIHTQQTLTTGNWSVQNGSNIPLKIEFSDDSIRTRGVYPQATSTYICGSNTYRWQCVYTDFLNIASGAGGIFDATNNTCLFGQRVGTNGVVVNAANNGILYLGYWNTGAIDFFNGKAKIQTNGSLVSDGSIALGGKTSNDGATTDGVFIGNYGAIQIARNGGNPYVGLYDVANGNSVTWDKIAGSIACSNISGYFNVNYGTAQSNYRLYVNGSSYFSGGIEAGSWVHIGGNLTVKGNTYHDNGAIRSEHTYNKDTVTNGANMYITSNGWIRRTTGSSERWKTDITEEIEDRLNPEALYKLPVKQFKYKEDCISKDDIRYGKNILGFIAEDVAKIYEPAVQYDENGRIEMWNSQVMTPAILRLVQKQNEKQILHNDTLNEHTREINNLKETIKEIQTKINNLL